MDHQQIFCSSCTQDLVRCHEGVLSEMLIQQPGVERCEIGKDVTVLLCQVVPL